MRLVHLADLHLGFRQFARQTPAGVNQREADVAATCARAIEQVITLRPDLVLVAGDVFHSVRPPNSAILDAFRLFGRLRGALPGTEVILIAGNHDVPRTADAGCILHLFEELGVRVVVRGPQRIDLPACDAAVLAVPFAPPGAAPVAREYATDPARRWNILLVHDEVTGLRGEAAAPDARAGAPVDPVAFSQAPWDYVALGHYHVYRDVPVPAAAGGRPIPAWYSGSLDYTSTNPWADVREERRRHGVAPGHGKGFIEHDLATGAHRFHVVAGARRLLDLPRLDATGCTAAELDDRIANAIGEAGRAVDDAIVRLVITNAPRHVVRTLDYTQLREVRRRALHFQLDARRPEGADPAGPVGAARRVTLRDRLAERLRARPLAAGLDRDRLVTLGLGYLTRAEDAAAAALPVAEG
jgi:exonuclease SbcD